MFSKSIVLCLIASFFVLLKIVTGSNLFLIVFLILIIYGICKEKNENRINYLLYFISWVYIIKFNLSQSSLMVVLSAVYCGLTLLHIIVYRKRFSKNLLFFFLLFLLYFTASLLQGLDQSISHIFNFVLGYMVLILASISYTPNISFEGYFFHYSVGILSGSIVSALGYVVPAINSYISSMATVNTILTDSVLYSRFAGLDIDPNYYAIQVMFAIALNILAIFYFKKRKVANIMITIALTIFGLLSFSKMYFITLLLLNILIIALLLRKNFFSAVKYFLFILATSILVFYKYGTYFYNAYFSRFLGQGTNLSDITTGRTDRWYAYFETIVGSIRIFLFGNGIANGFLDGDLSHNMYLLAFYQIGIIGVTLYLFLLYFTYKTMKNSHMLYKNKRINVSLNIIPLLIMLIPNFALDSFAMDYFPLQVFLVMTALLVTKLNIIDSNIKKV